MIGLILLANCWIILRGNKYLFRASFVVVIDKEWTGDFVVRFDILLTLRVV
jgi:hypothetical protein